ncbi:unnamed protein product, partial [Adineta ricciae]
MCASIDRRDWLEFV